MLLMLHGDGGYAMSALAVAALIVLVIGAVGWYFASRH
jgi:hypothetical protein